jgi:tetratricopeptide (TPR) repeat protein
MRLIVIFLVFCFEALSAQSTYKIDSLKRNLQEAKGTDKKIEFALKLTTYYKSINPDSSGIYLDEAKKFAKQSSNKKLNASVLLAEANQLQNLGRFDESIIANQESIKLFESLEDYQGIANAYNTLGLTYKKNSGDNNEVLGFSEKALEYENKSLEFYLKAKDFGGLIRAYSNIGIIHRDLKEYKKAEEAYIKGIELAEKNKYTGYSLGILKANLSQIYLDYYKKHNIAIDLLNEAIENYDKNEVISSKEHAYRNISYNYTALKDFQKAIFYANRAIEIANEVKDPHRKVMAYSALHHAQKMAGMYKESLENLEFTSKTVCFQWKKLGFLQKWIRNLRP